MSFWRPWRKPLELSVHEHGYGETPLVLIHGWGLGSHIWQESLRHLDIDFRIFTVDLPGHGESPPWPPYADLDEVAKAVVERVPNGAIWVGWSLGGLVALAAAASHVGAISGLCLLAANPRFIAGFEWSNGVSPEVFLSFKSLLESDPEGARRRFSALLMTNANDRRLISAALAQEPAWQDANNRLLKPLEVLETSNLTADLEHILCPVEWVLGDEDQLVPRGLAGALAHRRPDWGIRTVHGGHAFFVSRPKEFYDAVEKLRFRREG